MGRTEFSNADSLNIFLITIVAFAIRLWLVYHPDGPVFDEVHFGNFTNWYTLSQFYFDIHPPLGKLIMFLFANLSEYDGTIPFHNCPNRQYQNIDYIQLRITPAIFSALCAPLAYLSVRFSGFSATAAVTASVLVVCDTSLATEGRFILSDGLLHFFAMLHIAILTYTVSLPRGSSFIVWHILNGLSLGAACSCKNTAWGLMVLDAFLYFWYFVPVIKLSWLDYMFELLVFGGTLATLMVLVYVWSFSVHFMILPYAGQGYGYLKDDMKKQLIQNRIASSGLWGTRIVKPGLLLRTLEISWIMHSGNMGIKKFHMSESRPFNWPLLTGIDVSFWGRSGQEIKCQGNVFSYYFALLGVVVLSVAIKSPRYFEGLRFVVGWAACYFPFYLIPRTMYLYHYLIPLMLGCMGMGAALDVVLRPRYRGIVCVIVCACAIFGFWLWMPFVYGKYMHDRDIMIWNKNWIHGDEAYKKHRAEDRGGRK